MACDHGMMLMSDHDDAYVDAMLMVNMQANTRSVTEEVDKVFINIVLTKNTAVGR